MSLNFELKKLWKRKIIFVFLGLSILMSLYANFVLVKDQARRESDYSFIEGMDPYSEISMAIAPYRFESYRMDADEISLSEEFIERWDSLSDLEDRLSNMRRSYRGQILGTLEEPRNYAYPEDFFEYEKGYDDLNRGLLEFVRQYEKEYPFLVLSDATESNIEWILSSYEMSQATGDHVIKDNGLHYNANLVQRFLFQSRYVFGLPFILAFLLLFMGNYSGEKEQGTLEFLHMQPSNPRRIVFAKLLAMMISGFLYFILVMFFMGVVALAIGLPLDGFTEVYRVFSSDQTVVMLTGAQLLIRVFIAFMLTILFYSTLLLMISTRTGKISLTMAILFVFLGLNYVLLEAIPSLKNAYHPLYQLDYLQILIGKIENTLQRDGSYQDVVISAEGMKAYFALCVPSLVFLVVSMYPSLEQRSGNTEQRPARSFLALEIKKISEAQSFYYYLIGGALLLGIFFVSPLTGDAERIEAERLDTYYIQYNEELIAYLEEQYEERKKSQVDGGGEAVGIDHDTQLEMFEVQLAELQEELDMMLAKREALYAGDNKTYFENTAKRFNPEAASYEGSGILGGKPTRFSIDETKAILNQASQLDDPLIPMGQWYEQIQYSARENYNSPLDRQLYRGSVQPSHSAVFWPYRLLSRHHLDVILLFAMAVIVFAGYTLDKEEGNQLEFLRTQPLSTIRLHLTKLAAGTIMSSLFAAALLIFAALCGLVFEGIGAYRFPIVFYAGDAFSLIPLWQYLLMILGALVLQALFLNTLMLLVSTVVSTRTQLWGITTIILGAGFMINRFLPQGWAKTLSPFNYFEASNLANQAVRYYNDIPQASYGLGLAVLAVFGVIFTLIGIILISQQQNKPMA